MIQKFSAWFGIILLFSGSHVNFSVSTHTKQAQTEITKWQYGKKAAVSLTFDDNTINQFRVALPLMNERGFHGTFYVITGSVPGSRYHPKFIGRPVKKIIAETDTLRTNKNNFFERASAVRFLGYADTYKYHVKAGELYEQGRKKEAYKVIDKAYQKVRRGDFKPSPDSVEAKKSLDDVLYVDPDVDLVNWDQLRTYAEQGHEIGSHTVSHPYLSVLDKKNILYELKKSKEELMNKMGPEATFSAECPFGIEDDRVINQALQLYPALRNRMSEPYLDELNRSSEKNPVSSNKKYVQWQRGPLSDTPMSRMKSWVNTSLEKNNIWLVLVFHGVEGIGWEPLTRNKLTEYFDYIKAREDGLWVATFKDVTEYMRERMAARVQTNENGPTLTVTLSHSLDRSLYQLPLTLKTHVPHSWNKARIKQGDVLQKVQVQTDGGDSYIQYQARPNADVVTISSDEN